MMKLTKMISLVAVAVTLGVSGAELTTPTTAQAKTKYTMKTFPKAMRSGNWYAGYKPGAWVRKFDTKTYWEGFVASNGGWGLSPLFLKAHKLPFAGSKSNKNHQDLVYATKVNGRVKVDSWYSKGPKAVYYKVGTKTYNGKKVKVLWQYKSAKGKATAQYFKTKALTKQFNY